MTNPKATKFYIRYKDNLPETHITDYAQRGFELMGIETMPYNSYKDIEAMEDLGLTVGISGYIGDVLKGVKQLSRPLPDPIDYPIELTEYLGRKIRKGLLKEIINSNKTVFIKPYHHKAFTGFVYKPNELASNRNIIGHSIETPIWISEPIEIVSEYRSFILDGEILDVRRYTGDWSKAPNYDIVIEATNKIIKSAPCAFCLDWGITKDGTTILIEANDGFSFGHYGLLPGYVAQMLSARWHEMIS